MELKNLSVHPLLSNLPRSQTFRTPRVNPNEILMTKSSHVGFLWLFFCWAPLGIDAFLLVHPIDRSRPLTICFVCILGSHKKIASKK